MTISSSEHTYLTPIAILFITCTLQLINSLINLNKITLTNNEITINNVFLRTKYKFQIRDIKSFNRVNGSNGARTMHFKAKNKKFSFKTSEIVGLDAILDQLISQLKIDSSLSSLNYLDICTWITGISAIGYFIFISI